MANTDKIWAELLEESQTTNMIRLLNPLLSEAIDDPILRQLRPFTSHSRLRLSRCISFPFSQDCPWADPVYEQYGVYRAFDRYGKELGIGNANKISKLLAGEIPPHYVPAIEGNMYDLKEYIRLRGLDIKNTNLQEIEFWVHLEGLFLEKTDISDDSLQFLAGLKNLQQLESYENKITDNGLKYLSTLSNLRILRIWGANICGSGFIYLKGLPNLRFLTICRSPAPKMDLQYLPKLESLEGLALDDTNTSDQDLEYITHIPNLRWINLTKTKVTSMGISYLINAKPSLKVSPTKT